MILKAKEFTTVFITGALLYSLCEILWRGHTHWTMVLLGGICFIGLYYGEKRFSSLPVILRCFSGSIFITSLELITGSFVNTLFKMRVWDYSSEAFNLFGQICLKFSVYWAFLCLPAFGFCNILARIFNEKH
ncbi:MAG: hypothetical protein E7600_04605 [Ruminococcaceae bacterium]|nr:hypothetical protein [Oscillospiraceae bacterium]